MLPFPSSLGEQGEWRAQQRNRARSRTNLSREISRSLPIGQDRWRKKAIPSQSMIQQSAPAHCNGQAVARCADNEPNFCLGDTAPKTSKSAEYVWPEHYGVTSPNVDSQIALPAMISPGQAGIQSSMPGQTLEWSSQPLSSLVLSAFAMGAAWATRPRLT